jgi:hypothetical protein
MQILLLLLLLLLLQVRESDIGTRAGLFEVVKLGDEFFTFIVDCKVIILLGVGGDRWSTWSALSMLVCAEQPICLANCV